MKSYRQFCGIAKALDLVGQRWTMLILRELLLGPRRYSELQRSLDGITTNLLAKRMRELEGSGLVEKIERSDGRRAWALTPDGEAVKPALLELGRFGARWMDSPDGDRVSERWFVVSLQRRYMGDLPRTTGGLRFGETWYTVDIEGEVLAASDGRPTDPDFTVEGAPLDVVALLSGGGADGGPDGDPDGGAEGGPGGGQARRAAASGGEPASPVLVTGDRRRLDALVSALASSAAL